MKLNHILEARYPESDVVQWIRHQLKTQTPGNVDDHNDRLEIPNRADEVVEILTRLFKREPETSPVKYPHWDVMQNGITWRIAVRPANQAGGWHRTGQPEDVDVDDIVIFTKHSGIV